MWREVEFTNTGKINIFVFLGGGRGGGGGGGGGGAEESGEIRDVTKFSCNIIHENSVKSTRFTHKDNNQKLGKCSDLIFEYHCYKITHFLFQKSDKNAFVGSCLKLNPRQIAKFYSI